MAASFESECMAKNGAETMSAQIAPQRSATINCALAGVTNTVMRISISRFAAHKIYEAAIIAERFFASSNCFAEQFVNRYIRVFQCAQNGHDDAHMTARISEQCSAQAGCLRGESDCSPDRAAMHFPCISAACRPINKNVNYFRNRPPSLRG
jgi:hypothetical protein